MSAEDVLSDSCRIRKAVLTLQEPVSLWCRPLCAHLWLCVCSCWVAAGEPATPTNCLFVHHSGCCSVSVRSVAALLRGVHLSQAELCVGLNAGDIRKRETLTYHYPFGEAHHRLTAERLSLGHIGDSCDSLTSAGKLWWSCEKTTPGKKKKKKATLGGEQSFCLCEPVLMAASHRRRRNSSPPCSF